MTIDKLAGWSFLLFAAFSMVLFFQSGDIDKITIAILFVAVFFGQKAVAAWRDLAESRERVENSHKANLRDGFDRGNPPSRSSGWVGGGLDPLDQQAPVNAPSRPGNGRYPQ